MNPVLIFTDTPKINEQKNNLNQSVTLFQNIYNAFKAIDITPTILDISQFVSWTIGRNGLPDMVDRYISDKVLAAAGGFTANGIAIKSDVLRSMLVMPNSTNVKAEINKSYHFGRGTRVELLSVIDDVVTKVEDSDTQIEAIYSYFTKTDTSSQLATDLFAICASLNTFDDSHNKMLVTNLNQYLDIEIATNEIQKDTTIQGIARFKGQFVPSLTFIRRFEARQVA